MVSSSRLSIQLVGLCIVQFFSAALHADWIWYRPVPVIVHREPSVGEFVATSVVAAGACVGLGIAAIVEHRAQKRMFKEYIETFRDMGYSKHQAKIYAQLAMENPEGLQAVVRSIDQEKLLQAQIAAQHEMIKKSHHQKLQDTKELHQQKLQEMSHEYTLKLMTYLVILLTTIIVAGLGLLWYRRR